MTDEFRDVAIARAGIGLMLGVLPLVKALRFNAYEHIWETS